MKLQTLRSLKLHQILLEWEFFPTKKKGREFPPAKYSEFHSFYDIKLSHCISNRNNIIAQEKCQQFHENATTKYVIFAVFEMKQNNNFDKEEKSTRI